MHNRATRLFDILTAVSGRSAMAIVPRTTIRALGSGLACWGLGPAHRARAATGLGPALRALGPARATGRSSDRAGLLGPGPARHLAWAGPGRGTFARVRAWGLGHRAPGTGPGSAGLHHHRFNRDTGLGHGTSAWAWGTGTGPGTVSPGLAIAHHRAGHRARRRPPDHRAGPGHRRAGPARHRPGASAWAPGPPGRHRTGTGPAWPGTTGHRGHRHRRPHLGFRASGLPGHAPARTAGPPGLPARPPSGPGRPGRAAPPGPGIGPGISGFRRICPGNSIFRV